jgi:hypothetical protein
VTKPERLLPDTDSGNHTVLKREGKEGWKALDPSQAFRLKRPAAKAKRKKRHQHCRTDHLPQLHLVKTDPFYSLRASHACHSLARA